VLQHWHSLLIVLGCWDFVISCFAFDTHVDGDSVELRAWQVVIWFYGGNRDLMCLPTCPLLLRRNAILIDFIIELICQLNVLIIGLKWYNECITLPLSPSWPSYLEYLFWIFHMAWSSADSISHKTVCSIFCSYFGSHLGLISYVLSAPLILGNVLKKLHNCY